MKNCLNMNEEYKELLERYTFKDAIMAIIFYLIYFFQTFSQGYVYMSKISADVLDFSQIIFGFFTLVLLFLFIWISKDKLITIGLSKKNIRKSFLLGIVGAATLLTYRALFDIISKGTLFSFEMFSGISLCTFAIGALSEEIIFRGYIRTRLSGIIKNEIITSGITAILFLSIHYPVRWALNGAFTFNSLSGFHISCLILLHFACDFVFRKTNCLWGSVLLHMLYNIIGAMMIFR